MPIYSTWHDLVKESVWAELVERRSIRHELTDYSQLMYFPALLANRDYLARDDKFSIDATTPMKDGVERRSIHHWVYPSDGDAINFYNTDKKLVGTWDGKKIVRPLDKNKSTSKEYAKTMFTAHTVRVKGGYKAQVLFGGEDDDYDARLIVWEGDDVYKSDPSTAEEPQTGEDKALAAAESAVEQAVESLFAKVKV